MSKKDTDFTTSTVEEQLFERGEKWIFHKDENGKCVVSPKAFFAGTNPEDYPPPCDEADAQLDSARRLFDDSRNDGRGKSAGTKANLENYQWVKGESGNPSGRPLKNKWFRKAMRKFGDNKPFSELARAWSDSDATAETNRDDLIQGLWKDVTGNDSVKKYKALSLMLKYDVIEPIEPETS